MSVRQGSNIIAGTQPVDQLYNGTSTNAQSGVAIEGELANYATTTALATKQDAATALTTTNTYYDSATSTLYIG